MFINFLRALLLISILTTASFTSEARFTSQEINKIKQIMHEMASIVEDNHSEILEIEDVLSRSSTKLRKARTKEKLRRKINSMKGRLKDLRTVRSQFAIVQPLKEFVISVDDRIKVIEDNLAIIEKIYFPVLIDNNSEDNVDEDYPTFINPGDPRYELDEDQEKLAKSINKTRNLMSLRASREPVNDQFESFVEEVDMNLKVKDKPQRRLTPVLGRNTLDQFHDQLEESQRRDPSFDWNDKRSDREFSDFFIQVERMNHETSDGKKVVIGKSNLDSPEGPRSRKTFDNLVEQMSKESSKWTDHKVVLETIGKRKKIKGLILS